jgi:ABC-2 type transport system ATP-binding protein
MAATAATAAVEISGLRHRFKETLAVDNLSLSVRPGEIFGLLGPNGAGKTTTIRVLTTLLPPQAGEVAVFGRDVRRGRMAVRRLIGYVPQALSADAGLSGRENVALFARLFDVPRAERRARTDAVIEAMGLAEAADRPAGTYSGGMVRRLELAQALVSAPRLLVLDEPTIGLDPVARAAVWERITQVRADTGMTVLVTTHYMEEAEEFCDRVALMHRGRMQALGTPAELVASAKGEGLDDVFRVYTGDNLESGGFRDVRATRRHA